MDDRPRPSVLDPGAVDSEVSLLRDTGYLAQYPVRSGACCPQCGSGEIWQPMQTMDMPMYCGCLRCGEHAPSSEFTIPSEGDNKPGDDEIPK